MTTATFTRIVPAAHVCTLEEKIEALSRKAVKLGKPALAIKVSPAPDLTLYEWNGERLQFPIAIPQSTVEITGERPKLAGWELVAVKSIEDNGEPLFRTVPGQTVPETFHNGSIDCAHCQQNRARKNLVIVRHDDGRVIQVGTTCLSDFLGGVSVEALLGYASILHEAGEGEGEDWGGGGQREITTVFFVAVTVGVIRRDGWLSNGAAKEKNEPHRATVNGVWRTLFPGSNSEEREYANKLIGGLTPGDNALAAAALNWARTVPAVGNDYLYNLGVACRQETVSDRNGGIVASVVSAYRRAQERDAAQVESTKGNATKKHLGAVGEKLTLSATVQTVKSFTSRYGARTLVRLADTEGNVLVWWAGDVDSEIETGSKVEITGKIKAHEAYNGCPQTVITRCKIHLSAAPQTTGK